jgi:hypothetical protein
VALLRQIRALKAAQLVQADAQRASSLADAEFDLDRLRRRSGKRRTHDVRS